MSLVSWVSPSSPSEPCNPTLAYDIHRQHFCVHLLLSLMREPSWAFFSVSSSHTDPCHPNLGFQLEHDSGAPTLCRGLRAACTLATTSLCLWFTSPTVQPYHTGNLSPSRHFLHLFFTFVLVLLGCHFLPIGHLAHRLAEPPLVSFLSHVYPACIAAFLSQQ